MGKSPAHYGQIMEKIIREALLGLADEKNAANTDGLITTEHKPVLGVRLPVLRNYAQNIIKIRRYNEYLNDEATDEYLEETLLRGLIIGYGTVREKEDIVTALELLDEYLPLIDNWLICDTFCNTFKIAGFPEYREEVLNHIIFFLKFGSEFAERTAFIIFLNHLLKYDSKGNRLSRLKSVTLKDIEYTDRESAMLDKFLPFALKSLEGRFYSQMGAAWFLAEAFNVYPDKIWKLLQSRKNMGLDNKTYLLTLRKITESKIPCNEVKEMIKQLKMSEADNEEQ